MLYHILSSQCQNEEHYSLCYEILVNEVDPDYIWENKPKKQETNRIENIKDVACISTESWKRYLVTMGKTFLSVVMVKSVYKVSLKSHYCERRYSDNQCLNFVKLTQKELL